VVIDKLCLSEHILTKQAVKKNAKIGGKIRKPKRKMNTVDPRKMDTINEELDLEETIDMDIFTVKENALKVIPEKELDRVLSEHAFKQ